MPCSSWKSFRKFLRRLAGRQNQVDDALVVDVARVADFLRGSVSPNMFRQALLRFNDLDDDSRQAPAECRHNAGDSAICYLTSDGAFLAPLAATFASERANSAGLRGRKTRLLHDEKV